MWKTTKADLQRGLGAEEAAMLDEVTYEDVMDGDKLLRKVTDAQLGPVLAAMGIDADPFSFFIELIKIATVMQLVSGAALFYGAELLGGYDAGEAWRLVGGLGLGYCLRPFFKMEQLLWPVYNAMLGVITPGEAYEVPPSSTQEMQSTLNRLGILIAVCFFLPQAVLHWDVAECVQLVAPLGAGLFLFDIVYLLALMVKVGRM
ncbi:hypothetical protein FOA52_004715 [Chlamydomonas sp. UWO 241]|nr:hypothetical protein FOA52_004715 [Chlamydomonas sp. UWO 241]